MNEKSAANGRVAFTLVLAASVLALSGTDLILPAIPSLPGALGGTTAEAQHVIAAYTAGTAIGILLFGELGARNDQRTLLWAAMAVFVACAAAAAVAPSMPALIAIRFLQGIVGAAAAVFAPGFIRMLFADEKGAVRALGVFASVEALAPALAPIAGLAIISSAGWRGAFVVMAVAGAIVGGLLFGLRKALPRPPARAGGGYLRLLRDGVYVRYAGSQALTVASLLVFVFGAPAVFVGALGASLTDFVIMQCCGIALFIFAANGCGALFASSGPRGRIMVGSAIFLAGALAMLVYALADGRSALVATLCFLPMNFGLGLRGPPGFFMALERAGGDEARGSALVLLGLLMAAAAGTALAAPFLGLGLGPLALATAALALAAQAFLLWPARPAQIGSSTPGAPGA